MSNTFLDARATLERAGYRIHVSNPSVEQFYFEDQNILGVLHVLPSVSSITSQWEPLQDQFLKENAKRLVFDPLKAWNCYTVFLTSEEAEKNDASTLFMIEEDFRGTRKLVRTGITTRTQMEEALAPILPLRHVLPLAPEDAKTLLLSRLGDEGSPLRALLTDIEPNKIAASLVGPE